MLGSPSLDRIYELAVKLLEIYGSTLRASGRVARLTTVETPEGTIFIKENEEHFHISTPGYSGNWSVLSWSKVSESLVCGDSIEASRWIPYLERKLVLDILAEA